MPQPVQPVSIQSMPTTTAPTPAPAGNSPNLFSNVTNWMRNLINPQPQPTHLFQSRITRTPGGMMPVEANTSGAFDPNANPMQMVQSSNLPPDQKAAMAQYWSGMGKGFIMVPQDVAEGRSDVMRHEQLHALQQQSPDLAAHAAQIAALVDPTIADGIKANPMYQSEMKVFGPTQTLADEGSAIDLISAAGRAGGPTKQLRDYMAQLLARQPQQQRQFQRLTQTSPQ